LKHAAFISQLLRSIENGQRMQMVIDGRPLNWAGRRPLANILHGSDCIVSGDADLLALSPLRNIPIVSPEVFVQSMAREPRRRQGRGLLRRNHRGCAPER
jgi:hypothetical protein